MAAPPAPGFVNKRLTDVRFATPVNRYQFTDPRPIGRWGLPEEQPGR